MATRDTCKRLMQNGFQLLDEPTFGLQHNLTTKCGTEMCPTLQTTLLSLDGRYIVAVEGSTKA